MTSSKYLDSLGVSYLWNKIKNYTTNHTYSRATDGSNEIIADDNTHTIQIGGSGAITVALAEDGTSHNAKFTISTTAEANQNAFSNVKVGSTTVAADSKTDTLELVGSNVTLTPDATNDKVTIGITASNVTTALGNTPVARATADASGNTITTTYAPLASPALTGTPTAPTATAGTNTTQIATTAFVHNEVDNKHKTFNLGSLSDTTKWEYSEEYDEYVFLDTSQHTTGIAINDALDNNCDVIISLYIPQLSGNTNFELRLYLSRRNSLQSDFYCLHGKYAIYCVVDSDESNPRISVYYYDSLGSKADKVTSATANNLAALDSNGNLIDSGISITAASTDTKNTAGSTNDTAKLFLVGAKSQAANPQTYSNSNVYATNGALHATTYNDLTLTKASTGFTIAGGTTSKTLTVNESYTLAAACAKGVDTSITSGSTSVNVPTTAAVEARITSAIQAAQSGAAMYQGAAPTTFAPTNYKSGYYWIVRTAGTYVGQACEPGDMIFANTDSATYNANHFDVIQTNLDIASMTNSEIDAATDQTPNPS